MTSDFYLRFLVLLQRNNRKEQNHGVVMIPPGCFCIAFQLLLGLAVYPCSFAGGFLHVTMSWLLLGVSLLGCPFERRLRIASSRRAAINLVLLRVTCIFPTVWVIPFGEDYFPSSFNKSKSSTCCVLSCDASTYISDARRRNFCGRLCIWAPWRRRLGATRLHINYR